MTLIDKIEARIERIPFSSCWIYTGSIDTQGYGRFHPIKSKRPKVHRVVYEHYRGPIPDGLTIDHLCRVRCCCNPDHKEAVTSEENVRRQVSSNSLKTRCPRGHEYNAENTHYHPTGRHCRVCDRDRHKSARREKFP
jgi:hypothetical protein